MLHTKRHGAASIIVIIILLALLIGAGVWYAFWGKPKAQEAQSSPSVTASASPSATPDPYAGWKSYTLKYEKFTFKYPADWTLVDSSQAASDSDRVAVKSKDGFILRFNTNVWGIGGACQECKNFEMTKETILGALTGVNIYGTDQGASGIGLQRADGGTDEDLTCIGLCSIPGKNAVTAMNGNKPGLMLIAGSYLQNFDDATGTGNGVKTFPVATFKSDPNVATARKIFASMTY